MVLLTPKIANVPKKSMLPTTLILAFLINA
jgi:hypothetical protein